MTIPELIAHWRDLRDKAAEIGLAYAGKYRGHEAAGCCEALELCADELEALVRSSLSQPQRMFSIQGGPDIPWSVIAPFDKQCQRNHGGQTLERLHQRGGLGVTEAIAVLHAEYWDVRYEHGLPSKADAILELVALVKERQSALSSLSVGPGKAFTDNEIKDVLTALYQDGHVDLVLADRVAALLNGPAGGASEDATTQSSQSTGASSSLSVGEPNEPSAWLVELGCSPPKWWTGRGDDEWTPYVNGTPSARGGGADHAIRFARREDAERAIGWLIKRGVSDGCKATEHIWMSALSSCERAAPQEKPCANGHVWSNQFGDDWTPEENSPCDCRQKLWVTHPPAIPNKSPLTALSSPVETAPEKTKR